MAQVRTHHVAREKLIPKIERIVGNIEQHPVFEKEIKPGDTIVSQIWAGTLRFRVKTLWVVGSFAHGAKQCGDLDLIVEPEYLECSIKDSGAVAIVVRNRESHVDVLVGTPEKNHTGTEFPGAVLLWTAQDREWRPKVDSIAVIDGEIRVPRMTDKLPLSPKESRKSRDFALQYILNRSPAPTGHLRGRDRHWTLGSLEIFCAPSRRFSLAELDVNYACTSVIVAPPVRSDSALWVIRRSPTHPLVNPLLDEKC